MKKILTKIDVPLLICTILLCSIGLLMVFSSSSISAMLRYGKSSTYFFEKQLLIMGLSFLLGFIVLKIPTKTYKVLSLFFLIGIACALIFLLLYGGITNHAQSWIYIAGFALQPSEFAKSILIIFMGSFYGSLLKKKKFNLFFLLLPLLACIFLGILIMLQPDFGSALILLGIGFLIFLSLPKLKSKLPKIIMIFVLLGIIGGIVLLYTNKEILNSEQLSRFNFLNPCDRYKEKTGYQVCNGYIAINNGGLFGVGIGNSTQKYLYLPESHTDFIFAILIEELGLITGIFVLGLYVCLLLRILRVAKSSYTLTNSIIAYGVFWYISLHIIINLSGMLAILPLTGVPLPLLSYGGSATINFIVMIFIVERIAYENNKMKYKLELRELNLETK